MTRRPAFALLITVALSVQLLGQTARLADQQSRREAMTAFQTGMELLLSEKFEAAVVAFSKAIQKDPLLAEAYYELGQSFMALKRYASAQKAYRDCLQASRDLYDLQQQDRFAVEKERSDMVREMENTARRMIADGRPLQAIQLSGHVADLKRQETVVGAPFQPPAEALLALGSALFRDGQPADAELQWKAAVAANPTLGQAHNNLAVIYMQTGRLDAAEEELTMAEKYGMRVNPQFKEDLKHAKEQAQRGGESPR